MKKSLFKKPKTSKNIRKNTEKRKEPNEDPALESLVSDDEDYESVLNNEGFRRKRIKKASSAILSAQSEKKSDKIFDLKKKEIIESSVYQASRSSQLTNPKDMGATAINEIDTEHDRDALAVEKRAKTETKYNDSNEYRGMASYTKFTDKKESTLGSKARIGPARASSNIRVTCRFDYQPDICKDYKETGYCGYGDSCIFMHDRGNYKSSRQIDKEWEEEQRKLKEAELKQELEAISKKEDKKIPFACLICRSDFTRPVVTKCKHYFCEKCAMEHFKKSPKCFACGASTNGIFNVAKEIISQKKGDPENI